MKFLRSKVKRLLQLIRHHFSPRDLLILLALVIIFLFTRLINILQMPVFIDEGNYIVWAKQAIVDNAYFVSISDGKPPIPTWGAMSFIYFTPDRMLLGVRLFSVFSGFLGIIGFLILSYTLFGKRTAFISTFFYILTPFIIFYDRLGIVDALANASAIFILITSINLVRKLSWKSTILFGVTCGIGLLIKANVWLPIYLAFLAPILMYNPKESRGYFIKKVIRFIFLYIIAICIAHAMYQIQLLAPYPNPYELINNRSTGFLYTTQELLADPIGIFFKHVPQRTINFMQMTGWIALPLALLGFIHLFYRKPSLAIYVFIWFAAQLFAVTYLVEHFYDRYMIFLVAPIVLLAGYFISNIQRKKMSYILGYSLLICYIFINYSFLINYKNLHFPAGEREQFVEGIASGYGITEIVSFAKKESKEKPVIILGEGIFGLGSYIVESEVPMYEKNIEVIGLWPFTKEALESYQPQLKNKKVYIVMHHLAVKKIPVDWPLKKIKEYKKPYNTPYFILYELTR